MTFLAPAVGLIAGVLGVLGVLVSYFLKLRRRPVRVASTMLWEQAVQDLQVNAPFRMLRPSWLLLLQLLIVACLALALARPAVEGGGPDADRVILVIDRSASMRATDAPAGGSRFDEAIDRAVETVREQEAGARIMVIAAGAEPETAMGFTRDHGAVRAALRALEATDQPGDLGAAMRVVSAFTRSTGESEKGSDLPAIWVFTDGADIPPGGLGVPVPADRVVLARVGPEPGTASDNLGIAALAARRDFDDPALVRLFARVLSSRAQPSEATVRLIVDGQTVGTQRVAVPGMDDTGRPGEAPVTFELRDADGALALVVLSGEDALGADDQAGLLLEPPRKPRITLVQPAGAMTEAEALLIEGLFATEPADVERLTAEQYALRAEGEGAAMQADLLVFDGVRPGVLPGVPTLSFGAAIPVPGLRLTGDADDRRGQRVAFWSRSHPAMRYLSLGDVIITSGQRLTFPDTGDVLAEALATVGGEPFICAVEHNGVRRLVVSIRPERSTWARYASFPLFLANAVDWLTLTSARVEAGSATTARPASAFDEALVTGQEVTITGPNGFERTAIAESAGRVVFGVLPRTGRYVARLPSGDRDIIVNLTSAQESTLRTSDAPVISSGGDRAAGSGGGGTREVWRWFVLAGALLIALEWALYAWKMHL